MSSRVNYNNNIDTKLEYPKFIDNSILGLQYSTFVPKNNVFYCFFAELCHPNQRILNSNRLKLFGIEKAIDVQRFKFYPKTNNIYTFVGFSNDIDRASAMSKPSLLSSSLDSKVYIYPIKSNKKNKKKNKNKKSKYLYEPDSDLNRVNDENVNISNIIKTDEIKNKKQNESQINQFNYKPIPTYNQNVNEIKKASQNNLNQFNYKPNSTNNQNINEIKNTKQNNLNQFNYKPNPTNNQNVNEIKSTKENNLNQFNYKPNPTNNQNINEIKNTKQNNLNQFNYKPVSINNQNVNEIKSTKQDESKSIQFRYTPELSIKQNINESTKQNELQSNKFNYKPTSTSHNDAIMNEKQNNSKTDKFNYKQDLNDTNAEALIPLPNHRYHSTQGLHIKTFDPKKNLFYFFFVDISQPNKHAIDDQSLKHFGLYDASDIQRYRYYPGTQNIYTFVGFKKSRQREEAKLGKGINRSALHNLIYNYPYEQKTEKLFKPDEKLFYVYFKELKPSIKQIQLKDIYIYYNCESIKDMQKGYKIESEDEDYYTFFGFANEKLRSKAIKNLKLHKNIDSIKIFYTDADNKDEDIYDEGYDFDDDYSEEEENENNSDNDVDNESDPENDGDKNDIEINNDSENDVDNDFDENDPEDGIENDENKNDSENDIDNDFDENDPNDGNEY